jgi:hypothetical protein
LEGRLPIITERKRPMSWTQEREHRAKIASQIVDPAEYDKRRKTVSPARVDQRIKSAVESLKARAVDPPAEEPVSEEQLAREEQDRRNARRADTLRRMRKSDVLVQRMPDGSTKFKHDLGVSERRFGSGTGAPQ